LFATISRAHPLPVEAIVGLEVREETIVYFRGLLSNPCSVLNPC
jgi:hypothetical protein